MGYFYNASAPWAWTYNMVCTRVAMIKVGNKVSPKEPVKMKLDGLKAWGQVNWRQMVPKTYNPIKVEVARNSGFSEFGNKFMIQALPSTTRKESDIVRDIKIVGRFFYTFDQKKNVLKFKPVHQWK